MIRLVLIAAALVPLLAAPAEAGPVVAALTTAFTAAGVGATAAAALATGIVRAGVGLLLSAISTALRGKPRSPGIATETTQTGGQNPQTFILGRYATAGTHVCPPMSHGEAGKTPNAYLTYVIDLGDLPVTSVDKVWIGEKDTAFDGAVHADYGNEATGDFAGRAWLKVYDGTQTTADAMLLAKYGSYPERPWSADMVGTGVPYAILTFRYDREVFNGLPQVRFEVTGIPLYDPRRDGTAGGTGTHRWADPATWEPSLNPMVQAYNLLRGITLPDGSVYGAQVLASGLPTDVWFAAMNACDADAEIEGGTEPSYRAGFEVNVADEPFDVLDELMKAASAEYVEAGGTWYVRVGPVGLPVYFFSDDDILRTSEQDLDPFPGLEQTHNAVHATYPDPSQLWEAKDAPPRYDSALEAEDNGRRLTADLALPAVPYADQVQRLMKAWIEDARRFRQHGLTLPPEALAINPLEAVSWTSTRNGYIEKVFEVGTVQIDPRSLNVALSLRERDPGDYDWVAGDLLPAFTPSTLIVDPSAIGVPGWAVTAVTITDVTDTARRAGIKLAWTPALDGVRGVKWEVRRTGTSEVILTGSTTNLELGHVVLSENLLGATAYEARGRLQTDLPTVWTNWTAVTTPDVGLAVDDLSDDLWTAIDAAADAVADQVLAAYDQATVQPIVDLQALIAGQLVDLDGLLDGLTDPEAIAVISTELQGIAAPLFDVVAGTVAEVARIDVDLELDEAMIGDSQDAIDTINAQLAQLWSEYSFTSTLIAGAGIYVDEATGKVEIAAFQTSQDQITEVAIRLDAAEATLALTATQAYVNQAVSDALLDPSQIPVVADLKASIATLQIELDAAEAAIELKADLTTVTGIDVRVTSAEVDIDALEAQIALAVTQTEFGDLEDRVTSAEVILDATDGATISQLVSDVRLLQDGLDESDLASLESLLAAYDAREGIYAEIAYARQDITARIVAGEEAFAAQTLELAAAIGDNLALIEQETSVRATETAAIAEDVSVLQVETAAQAAQIVAINTVEVDSESAVAAGLAQLQIVVEGAGGTVEAIEQLEGRVEDTEAGLVAEAAARTSLVASAADIEDNAALNDLASSLSTYEGRLAYEAGIAQAREELTALVVQGVSAEAAARLALEATVAGNAATLATEQLTRATADSALARDITDLQAVVTDPETGLEATASALAVLSAEVGADANGVLALAGRVEALEVTVEDPATGVVATAAGLSSLATQVSTQGSTIAATVERVDDLEATVDDPATGVVANAAAIDGLQSTVTTQGGVLTVHSGRLTELEGAVNDPATGNVALGAAVSDLAVDITANGNAITVVSGRVDDLEAVVENPTTGVAATATALGQLAARVDTAEDAITVSAQDIVELQATVGQGANLVPDAQMTEASLWTLGTGWTFSTPTTSAKAHSGIGTLLFDWTGGTGDSASAYSATFPVESGQSYSVRVETSRRTASGAWHPVARLRWLDADDVQVGTNDLNDVALDSGAVVELANTFVAPTGAVRGQWRFFCRRSTTASDFDIALPVVEQITTADAANAAAVSSLTVTVTAQGEDITAISGDVTDLEAAVFHPSTGLAATSAALSQLATTVTSQGNTITAQGQDITALESTVNNPTTGVAATAAGLSSLTTTVTSQGSTLSAVASDVTSLETTVGQHTTQINQTISAVDGIEAVYAIEVNNNGHISGFGLVSDLVAGNPVASFVVVANSFALVAPNGTQQSSPFIAYTTPQVIDGVAVPAGVYLQDAYIRRGMIGRAEVTDVIESDTYAESGGLPTSGIQIDFAAGRIKAADVVLSRNIVADSGSHDLGVTSIGGGSTGAFAELQEWWVQTTIPLSAWGTTNKTYIATADLNETAVNSPAPNNCWWGLTAEVLPLTAFYSTNNSPSGQFLYLRVRLWGRQVNTISRTGGGNLEIGWTIYQVT